jgi:hypothetical protein
MGFQDLTGCDPVRRTPGADAILADEFFVFAGIPEGNEVRLKEGPPVKAATPVDAIDAGWCPTSRASSWPAPAGEHGVGRDRRQQHERGVDDRRRTPFGTPATAPRAPPGSRLTASMIIVMARSTHTGDHDRVTPRLRNTDEVASTHRVEAVEAPEEDVARFGADLVDDRGLVALAPW